MMKSRSYFSMRLLVVTATIAGLTAATATVGADGSLVRLAESPELEWVPCPEFMPDGCALAVLQGNPAERNVDVFFKLPSKATAPSHWHTSAERMVLVSGEMRVHYEGQDPAVLEEGMYAYGPARLPHEATCVSGEDCVLFIAFEEPVDAFPAE
jgi:quercetin dioxygenase-like cupin family protein